MGAQSSLRAKLRKIEALVEGAGTPDERRAAEAAVARMRAKLGVEATEHEEHVEQRFTIDDAASRHLFIALCRRHGYPPYRRIADGRATVSVYAPRRFIDGVLARQFRELDTELRAYLAEVSLKIIREEVHADTSDVHELQSLPAPEPEPVLLLTPADREPWFRWTTHLLGRLKRIGGPR
jgi:hypothetical protein